SRTDTFSSKDGRRFAASRTGTKASCMTRDSRKYAKVTPAVKTNTVATQTYFAAEATVPTLPHKDEVDPIFGALEASSLSCFLTTWATDSISWAVSMVPQQIWITEGPFPSAVGCGAFFLSDGT